MFDQSWAPSKTFCGASWSPESLITLHSLLSSAKSLYDDENVLPKLLMKIRKRIGRMIDPCGTPLVTSLGSELLLLILTFIVLLQKALSNRSSPVCSLKVASYLLLVMPNLAAQRPYFVSKTSFHKQHSQGPSQ